MTKQVVQSSVLTSVGYDAQKKILELEFRDGGTWNYFGLPLSIYNKFIQAESLGNFFVTRIKGRYPELRVR